MVRLFERYVAATLLMDGIMTTTTAPAAATRRRERLEARDIEARMTKGTNRIGFTTYRKNSIGKMTLEKIERLKRRSR